MGAPFDSLLAVGSRVLRGAAHQGEVPPYGDPGPGVQMDPGPVSLLEGWQALRRTNLPTCACGPAAETARRPSCGIAVEKCSRLQQNCGCWGLTEQLRRLRCSIGLSRGPPSTNAIETPSL